MGTLNVNRNVADAFYRYKMPRICAKVEGKGNGIKTVIVNMPEVAKALGRPATCEYPPPRDKHPVPTRCVPVRSRKGLVIKTVISSPPLGT